MISNRADAVRETAAAWYLRLSQPIVDQADFEKFEAWRRQSAEHRSAYDQVSATLDEFDLISGSPEITALKEQTHLRLASHKAVLWNARTLAKVASLLLCVGIALWFGLSRAGGEHVRFQTDPGQRQEFLLSDGSHLTLDSDTLVETSFSSDLRSLRLERGQARFRVAHDASRPFRVVVGKRTVEATGTDFNIEKLPSRSVITLLNGGVNVAFAPPANWLSRVFEAHTDSPIVKLRPGERIDVPEKGSARLRRINPKDAIAWEHGWIAFDDEPLSLAIERFNRYSQRKVRLKVRLPEDYTVSGLFELSNPDAFAGAAAQLFRLDKFEEGGGDIWLRNSR